MISEGERERRGSPALRYPICTYMIRTPELEIYARIGITKEAYEKLRKIKLAKKQSMAKIVTDLILDLDYKILSELNK